MSSNNYTPTTALGQISYDPAVTFVVKPDTGYVTYGSVKGGTTLNFKVDNAANDATYKITIDDIDCPQQGNAAG